MTLATDIQFVQQDIRDYQTILARLEANGCNFGNNDHYKEIASRLQGKQALLARLEQKESGNDHTPA